MGSSRSDFQWLAKTRIREAKALLDQGLFDGAYYLAGYAVECALKACIVKKIKRSELPDKKFIQDVYTHKLGRLLGTNGAADRIPTGHVRQAVRLKLDDGKRLERGDKVRNSRTAVYREVHVLSRNTPSEEPTGRRACASAVQCHYRSSTWSIPMVKEVLVDKQIEAGRVLTERLDKGGFPVTASFWLFDSDTNDWRLTIALEAVDRIGVGARKVYGRIQDILSEDADLGRVLDLQDIHLAGPMDNLIRDFRKLRQRKLGVVRLKRTVVGGRYVEDAYVYKAA